MGTICSARVSSDSVKKVAVNPQAKGHTPIRESRRNGNRDNRIQTIGRRDSAQHVVNDPRVTNGIIEEAATAHVQAKKLAGVDRQLVIAALNSHFILKNLDTDTKNLVINHMLFYRVGARQEIFKQGQPGKSFYVVSSGRVEIIVNGHRKEVLKQGRGFGELALIEDSPRTATVRTIEKSTLWGLDRETFKQAIQKINEQNYDETIRFLQSVPLLQMLTSEQQTSLASCFTCQYWSAGEPIVKEGDTGDLFYIIKEGCVVCSERGKIVRQMGKGDYFGELALLYNSTRTATVTCQSEVKVLSIGRTQLTEVLGSELDQVIYKNSQRIIIEHSPTLKLLSPCQIDRVIGYLRQATYHDEDVVIPAHSEAYLYLVLKGSVKSGKKVHPTSSCIGDTSLNTGWVATNDYFATGETIVASIDKTQFETAIGGPYEHVRSLNEIVDILKQVHLLRGLPENKVRQLMEHMKVEEYPDHTLIVAQNTPGDSFYIVKSGTVEIVKENHVIRTISTNDYFGERSVLFDEIRTANVVSKGPVACWVLNKEDFANVIDGGIRKQLMKRIALQDDTVQLTDLVPVKILGKGSFGHVYLTVHREKKTLYSLKTVSRAKIGAYGIFDNVVHERELLLQLDHFMIMKLVKTFKDAKRLYFLMEHVKGRDLFDVLQILNLLRESDAKFYTGCLVLIIEYLQERSIVYRDLKPENVMVDEDGYPKLIDFGTAKIVTGRTYTRIGTPHYMAPELIMGNGYTIAVDWWSIGVMLYEFLYGMLPFGDSENNPQAVYERILEHRLTYPFGGDPLSSVRSLIQQLLSKNPLSRTGGSSQKLKAHRWFSNFNWEGLLSKQIKPPYVPCLKNLDVRVQAALKKNQPLSEFIDKEEVPSFDSNKKQRVPPPNWDAEF